MTKYRVPSSGYYLVNATCTMFVRTGEFEFVPDPGRWFFQFWKPRLIRREILRPMPKIDRSQVAFLRIGEELDGGALRL